MNKDQRIAETRVANAYNALTSDGFRTIIRHCVESLNAKGIKKIQQQTPEEWGNWLLGRVGTEPVARLYYVLCMGIMSTKPIQVGLVDFLCEDPALMHECMTKGDITPYYNEYPSH